MLTNSRMIKGYRLNGVDGEVGSIKEFFFDDKFWTIRYLVANTGNWLSRRQVLISPYFLLNVNHGAELIDVNLTKSEIENSPPLESDKPVSRHYEESYYGYFGAPVYWGGPSVWGTSPYLVHEREKWDITSSRESEWDPDLQSSRDVSGLNIQATDGEIGHVDDFLIDDKTWSIRYLVIDTKNWLPGKKILISPQWINSINWEDKKVVVDLTRETIKHAPEYDVDAGLTRGYESKLHQYYNRKGYWTDEFVASDYSSRSGMDIE